jgi:hypothetical protein
MYTAAVLNPKSAEVLKKTMRDKLGLEGCGFECQTPQGEPLPHHMTINMGPLDTSINDPRILDKPAILCVDSIWYCKTIGACAAKILFCELENNTINSTNSIKHITICLKPPAKAFHSNKIFTDGEYIKLDEPLILEAHVREIE